MQRRLLGLGLCLTACAACAPADAPSSNETEQRILSGTRSTTQQDAVVSIRFEKGGCTGTLIAPNLVLTALHCVAAIDASNNLGDDFDPSTISIAVGRNHGVFDGRSDANGLRTFHDQGVSTLDQHDIALILLDRELKAPTATIRQDPVQAGDTVTAVGFGVDEGGRPTQGRMQTQTQVLGIGPAQGDLIGDVPEGELYTSGGVCHGDSGGPIFDDQGQIVGVASRVSAQAANCVDNNGEEAIYSMPSAHMDLIQQAASEAGYPVPDQQGYGPQQGRQQGQQGQDPQASDEP